MSISRYVVYADAFGAMPNPEIDSGPAIQEAINSIPNNVIGTVALGEHGVYVTKQPLKTDNTDGCYEIKGVSRLGTLLQGQCANNENILTINKEDVSLSNFGIVSHAGYINNGINITKSRHHINSMWIFTNGDGLTVENAHSVYVLNCMGATQNVAIKNAIPNFGAPIQDKAWIRMHGAWVSQIVIQNNICETMYSYAVKGECTEFALVVDVTSNQFEAIPGIYLNKTLKPSIEKNYLAEGAPVNAYPIYLSECLYANIQSNFIPHSQYNTLGTIYLYKTYGVIKNQFANRIIVKSPTILSNRISIKNTRAYYIQNDLIDKKGLDLINVYAIQGNIADRDYGKGRFISDNIPSIGYPYINRGDIIEKRSIALGYSPGWNCTNEPLISAVTHVNGNGPLPVIDNYFNTNGDKFRITLIDGGLPGVGSFKVYKDNCGAWSEVNVDGSAGAKIMYKNNFHHYVDGYFSLKWIENQIYQQDDVFEFTGTPAVWLPMANLQ